MQVVRELAVRRADSSDIDALTQVDPYARAHPSRVTELRQALDTQSCLVAELRGTLAGYVVVEHGFFGHGFVPLVCVAPEKQGRGIGLALLSAAEGLCRTSKLFSSTNASNSIAQRLFLRAGFVRSGVIENLDDGDPELVYFKWVSSNGG